jgi:catechol 2,3-dioxygenase-like lactoylglutathione lyase family enzyme
MTVTRDGESFMSPVSPQALHHTAFVVRDLEATARSLSSSLGIGPWQVRTIRPVFGRLRGVDSPFSFRVALATVGGSTFELVSPLSGHGLAAEFLAEHGNGFHHTCLSYPSLAALRAAKASLVAEGRMLLQEAGAGDAFEFAYFDLPELGSVLELLFLDPSRMPPPDGEV